MKVIHLSASITGGAGIAAVRFHNLCKNLGYESWLYHNEEIISSDTRIISLRRTIFFKINVINTIKKKIKNTSFIKKYIEKKRQNYNFTPTDVYCFYNFDDEIKTGIRPDLTKEIDCNNVDIIFVYWMGGFLNTYDIKNLYEKTGARVVFSMMDMEPITGGCHFFWNCSGYKENCFNCPALPFEQCMLASRQLYARAKNIAYIQPDIFSSSLDDLKIAKNARVRYKNLWHCYYAIDDRVFKPNQEKLPISSVISRKKYIFSNSNDIKDYRKGFGLVIQVLFYLDRILDFDIVFLCLTDEAFFGYKFKHISFEKFVFRNDVNDLVNIYNQADVFICSSVEDAGPMMLAEAMFCGLPVVSFKCTTANQFIKDGENGFLVDLYDTGTMGNRLYEILKYGVSKTPQQIHEDMVKECGIEMVTRMWKQIIEG